MPWLCVRIHLPVFFEAACPWCQRPTPPPSPGEPVPAARLIPGGPHLSLGPQQACWGPESHEVLPEHGSFSISPSVSLRRGGLGRSPSDLSLSPGTPEDICTLTHTHTHTPPRRQKKTKPHVFLAAKEMPGSPRQLPGPHLRPLESPMSGYSEEGFVFRVRRPECAAQ